METIINSFFRKKTFLKPIKINPYDVEGFFYVPHKKSSVIFFSDEIIYFYDEYVDLFKTDTILLKDV